MQKFISNCIVIAVINVTMAPFFVLGSTLYKQSSPNKSPLQSYVISGGKSGSDRLKVLAASTWEYSQQALERVNIQSKSKLLDMGCGNGDITLALADCLGPNLSQHHITAIDADKESIIIAKESSKNRGISINWMTGDAREALKSNKYDFIYCRFLLSHLQDPMSMIECVRSSLNPNGVFLVEDIDFNGHFSYPYNYYFQRYLELYESIAKARGADPFLGPKLPGMLSECGFKNIDVRVILPTFVGGIGKRMAELTMINTKNAIVGSGIASEDEVNTVIRELSLFADEPLTMMSLPRIFQVSGSV